MKALRYSLLGVIVLLTVLGLAFIFAFEKHASVAEKSGSYMIDLEFDKVKKIMTKTNALDEIISYQHGKVISHKTRNLTATTDKLLDLKQYEFHMDGEFVVEQKEPDAGLLRLHFSQKSFAGKDVIRSENRLMEPVGHIKDVSVTTLMEPAPSGTQTKVTATCRIVYARRVPKNLIPYMDGKVDEAATRMQARGEEAMRALIDKYKDKKFILPIKRPKGT